MSYVIFGSGGLAKELIGYLEEAGEKIACVVSTQPFNNPAYKYTVYPAVPARIASARYLLAVADPSIKRKIVGENEDLWGSFIHHTANISEYARYGRGCIFAPQALVSGDPVLGDFVFLNTNATVGHDTVIGHYTTLFPNTEVCGDCVIGDDCIFGIGSYALPKVKLPTGTKVSAGAVVRKSIEVPSTLYGDPAMPRLKVA